MKKDPRSGGEYCFFLGMLVRRDGKKREGPRDASMGSDATKDCGEKISNHTKVGLTVARDCPERRKKKRKKGKFFTKQE